MEISADNTLCKILVFAWEEAAWCCTHTLPGAALQYYAYLRYKYYSQCSMRYVYRYTIPVAITTIHSIGLY